MSELFKDNIKKGIYNEKIDELINAIKTNTLENLLFGNTEKKVITHKPDRTKCNGFKNNATIGEDAEKRICKCLFYKNMSDVNRNCDKCVLNDYYKVKSGKYSIVNYEIPSYYSGKGIGEIDIVISDGESEYATEVKPHEKENKKENDETLLRMISEILTYTYGFEDNKYKKAIAFFENTPQYDEYQKQNSKISELINLANITVFLLKETIQNHKEYEILKIN